ncbi:Mucin 2, oligomeric mucus/gel-forming [Ceratobasidium theobromae]|uniref:Mucin 2, oligomeric mucus/gel-forming n=1 Tax=Ceratobasidium theobromae TaxID=1582974 RepID=A0A5N5QCW1_9AGAM|nr:Mucin 2, oligomeric mucus/gel-forming [Ceratobasidium theobromae]
MRLFSRKKSNSAIQDEPPPISRPRAQGHLPPTSNSRPPNPARRSFSSGQTPGEPVTTPLYARFARADSFENINLRAKPADSRSPSYAPSNAELEDAAKRLGYERPWAQEVMRTLDTPEPGGLSASGPNASGPNSSGLSTSGPSTSGPSTSTSTIRMVSKSERRLSLDAVAAQDPFMASKMQSVLRRAPSGANTDPPKPQPVRSATQPPTAPSSFSRSPPQQAPAPSRSNPRSPSARPSLDGVGSDDGMSTFSHSHTGHQTRPMYPAASSSNGPKRERGPPPVAGTPSAYAWRSGQSDDGHGSGNFYTGGSQTNPINPANSNLSALPPGAAPPNPSPFAPQPPSTQRKRTPSNPPVSRVPHPSHGRRMSVDGSGSALGERPLSGGPGTWGGSAIAPPPSQAPTREQVPTVKSVRPGEIFHHPQMGTSQPAPPAKNPAPSPSQPVRAVNESAARNVEGAPVEERGRIADSRLSRYPAQVQDGRMSPTKGQSNGRTSPSKPDLVKRTEAQSPFKPSEGPASPPKPSPLGNSPHSALSTDTSWSRTVNGAGSIRTVGGTGSATAGSIRTLDTNASGRATPGRSTMVSPATPNSSLSVPGSDPTRSSIYPTTTGAPTNSARSAGVAPPSPSKSSTFASPAPKRELPQPPPQPPSQPARPQPARREPSVPRAPSSASSYGTAMPLESDVGLESPTTKLALGGLAPINTSAAQRSSSPTPTMSSPAMFTARMTTPTTTAALSPMTIPSLPSSTPQRGLAVPRAVSPAPTTSTMRLDDPSESDAESPAGQGKKRNLLVKTRKVDGANSFKSSDERSERPVPDSPGPGLGLNGGEDPFARAPPTIVKTTKRTKTPSTPDPNRREGNETPGRAMPLSPPLSSDEHDVSYLLARPDRERDERSPMTPALTDEAPPMDEMGDIEQGAEPEAELVSTTPPGSPPLPTIYPLTTHLNMPSLLSALLPHLSFRDWNALNSLNAGLRRQLEETRPLREEVLEYWLRGVGYLRWKALKREPLLLSLRDLNAYMRGVSIALYRYSAIAESFLAVRAQQEQTKERVPGAASKGNLVRALASSCRAYTKVILRLREQAECMHPDGDFRSPLFKVGHAPLLRTFVPSKEGAWLSDVSVLDCEKELKRAGALGALRIGDVIWDAAVGDEGNVGRLVWDGNYLVDLDYTYSTTGELPKYIHSLAFSPSYWHKVIRTSNSPLCHIDLSPYAVEIAQNLQLVQDRVQTETPQGGRHTVVRWVHRSRFHPRPGLPIPSSTPPAVVDSMWEGTIVVEVEGTNEGLADLQVRVGNGVRLFPAKTAGMEIGAPLGKSPFRLLRSMSRPGEIWIRAVREKERLM